MPILQLVETAFFLIWWFFPELKDHRTQIALKTVAFSAAIVIHFWVVYGLINDPEYDYADYSSFLKQKYRNTRFYIVTLVALIMMVCDFAFTPTDSVLYTVMFWIIVILPICGCLHAVDWAACTLYHRAQLKYTQRKSKR